MPVDPDTLPAKRNDAAMVPVWDTDGKMHSVDHLNAHDLVTHLGWSHSSPIIKRETVQDNKPPKADSTASAPVTGVPATPPPSNPPIDLTALDRDGLVAFAKEKFDLSFEDTVSEEDIFDELVEKLTDKPA